MFNSLKVRSNDLVDTDTIELFSREDIRILQPSGEQQKNRTFITSSVLLLLLIVFIGISTLVLIRFSAYSSSVLIIEPEISDNSSDLIFNYNNNPQSDRHTSARPQCQNIEQNERFDCNPDDPINKDECLRRGCCWTDRSVGQTTNRTVGKPPLDVPFCYFGTDYVGYEVHSIETYLYRTVVTLNRTQSSGFLKDSQTVILEVIEINENSLRLKFYDPNQRRYEVPIPVLNVVPQKTIDKSLFKVKITSNGILMVVRQRTSAPVFKADLKRLVFSDQFLQLSSDLPSDYVYGIGEHKDGFRKSAKQWKRYTLFNRDQYPLENINLYGSHPFYLSVEDNNGNSNGVLLFNSNAMDVILQPKPAITWRTIGGILDFYVFLGPKPMDVIQQYTLLIGFPSLPPYWALGFHLCRFGYNSLENMITVFNRTRSAGIPYDVQWNDIDAMKTRNDFTYDDKNFAQLPKFVNYLHEVGMKYIPMFDPGISASEKPGTYPPFDVGMHLNIFVKNSSGKPFIGKVWNSHSTVWPDFTDPKAVVYWTQMFSEYHDIIAFDGAWIDMNEPSNFLDGSVNGCPLNSLENPQYTPGANDEPLRTKTMCMNARHFAGLHYDLHNLFGFSEAIATNVALRTVTQKRPVIISRSSFVGHGKYAGHWDGDIVADWQSMRWTIASILNFNLFAIPFVGADICGFNGNTTVELCARWSSLGAFYPFSRNHNSDDCTDQDPVALGPIVTASAKNALEMRYSLLPYLYTLFYRAHITGETVVRPLFFEFFNDSGSYEIETQFLWGPAVMVVPTLYPNMTFTNAYLPPGRWYDLNNYTSYDSNGQYFRLDSPLTAINVLLRSGYILVKQRPEITTTKTRDNDFELIVGLDQYSRAKGSLFWDSGDGLDNLLLRRYDWFEFMAQNNTLTSKPKVFGFDINNQKLSKVMIFGVKREPKSVLINGKQTNDYSFNSNINLLTIVNINGLMSQNIIIVWN